jgi:hypothetical protein
MFRDRWGGGGGAWWASPVNQLFAVAVREDLRHGALRLIPSLYNKVILKLYKHQPFYKKGFCLGSLAVPGALDIVPLIKVRDKNESLSVEQYGKKVTKLSTSSGSHAVSKIVEVLSMPYPWF